MPDHDRSAQVSRAVAANLRTLRTRRDWSLDQLAQRSGVSKGVLVAVEADRGNPSLTTLCRLADAFGVALTELVDAGRAPSLRSASIASAPTLWQGPDGGTGRLLLATDPPQPVELWCWRLHPGEERRSAAHAAGTHEALLVLSGRLDVRVAGEVLTAETGIAVTYPADVPHTYRSTGEEAAELVLVVSVPR